LKEKSATNIDVTQKLVKQFSHILKNMKFRFRIKQISESCVYVNNQRVSKKDGVWSIGQKQFFMKRSAIGYAILYEQKKFQQAKRIELHDRKICKLTEDVNFYMTKLIDDIPIARKKMFLSRLSRDKPLLQQFRYELDEHLKNIKIV